MHYDEILPSPPLRHLIKCFWALRDEKAVGPAPTETILPDGHLEIIFNLADRFRRFHQDGTVEIQPSALVVGQMKRSVRIQPTGRVDLFGVRFQTIGAYRFLRIPLAELTGRIPDLRSVAARGGRELEDLINEAPTTAGRIAAFEASMLQKNEVAHSKEMVVESVRRRIGAVAGTAPVPHLAREHGVSQRQLERHFRELVGVSPKFYSRVIRIQSIVNAAAGSASLLDAALSHGYFDQSHFIREFTEFAGKSPTAFMREQNQMAAAFMGV